MPCAGMGFPARSPLRLKDAPEGFTLSGGVVPEQQDQVRLTLAVPPLAVTQTVSLCMEGRAAIAGQEVVRRGVPADDMMQAFAYRHLVPASELWITVAGSSKSPSPAALAGKGDKSKKSEIAARKAAENEIRILGEKPVKIPAGGTARLRLGMPAYLLKNALKNPIQLELSDPPEGITVEGLAQVADGMTFALRSDAAKAKPGLKGNLILNVGTKASKAKDEKQSRSQERNSLGMLPAMPFEIVKP